MTVGPLGALVGAAVGGAVCSYIAQEVRAPRLLNPETQAKSELSPTCRVCHTLLRPSRPGLHINLSVLRNGQCPSCKHPVPRWGAWAELATVAMGALVGWRTAKPLWLPAFLLLGFVLVAVILVDARLHLISTKLVYPAAGVALVVLAVTAWVDKEEYRLQWALVGGLGASLFMWLLNFISPANMGEGDARLSLFLGLFLGWIGWRHAVIGIFAGFILGSIGGLILMIAKKAEGKSKIAFGPYLAAGALLVCLWPTIADGFAPGIGS